jgi:phospholipid/cholesterol/gamma-HCH transport system substrate-binding protein
MKPNALKPETKVGLLFIGAIVLVVGFAYAIGALNPFVDAHRIDVLYNYAGGIEKGSPVRVMGIKVGKVDDIVFDPNMKSSTGEEVKLRIRISVDKAAWETLREDSQFFINLAGVIGEKFIEISPGSMTKAALKPGAVVRGEDPPRIDQLISQSYGLAGRIMDLVEQNKGSVVDTVETINKLVVNLNVLLKQVEKTSSNKDFDKIVKNFITLTDDAAFFSQQLRSSEGQKTLALVKDLVGRLEGLDGKAIRKFLQEEGIKAKLF